MIMARTREDDHRFNVRGNKNSGLNTHAVYEVKSETGKNVGVKILILYYGDLWQSALDRLSYRFDGHMFILYHEGKKYSVYRKLNPEIQNTSYRLKLV